jgi:hypothetical protein
MTLAQIASEVSVEIMHQAALEDLLSKAVRLKRRIHEKVHGAHEHYYTALMKLLRIVETAESEALHTACNCRSDLQNLLTMNAGLTKAGKIDF